MASPEALAHSPSQMPLGCPVASSAPGRPKPIKLQATAPSHPRRPAPRNTSPRRRAMDLQATAPSPTPTRTEEHTTTAPGRGPAGHRAFAHADPRRAPRWAAYRAPPRPRPPARAKDNSARRRAADLAALRALTTPTAPKRPPRAPAPLVHADARGGTPRRDAGLQTTRPRRQSARKTPRKTKNCRRQA